MNHYQNALGNLLPPEVLAKLGTSPERVKQSMKALLPRDDIKKKYQLADQVLKEVVIPGMKVIRREGKIEKIFIAGKGYTIRLKSMHLILTKLEDKSEHDFFELIAKHNTLGNPIIKTKKQNGTEPITGN